MSIGCCTLVALSCKPVTEDLLPSFTKVKAAIPRCRNTLLQLKGVNNLGNTTDNECAYSSKSKNTCYALHQIRADFNPGECFLSPVSN